MTRNVISIPVFDGERGHSYLAVEDTGVVRFYPKDSAGKRDAKGYCFHISDPKAAADLIEILQPLADKKPRPRVVQTLGDDEKDAVWGAIQLGTGQVGTRRYMWSPLGWLKSCGSGAWRPYDLLELDGKPYTSQGFQEILD